MLISKMREQLTKGVKLSELPLRVTFYGRVSTDMEEQLSSLEHQVQYFTQKIQKNPKWEFVPGYIDEGITGTSVKKRRAFLRMIEDAQNGRFDLILTKEVSRFARDIVDSIQYTRKLLEYNVGVFFEDINLNTIEPDAEFRLSIMATVAQEESRKISQRVKFGYRQAALQGKRHGSDAPTGYVFNNQNNGYSIDPQKSKMIAYLFQRYAENTVGLKRIAAELYHMGFCSKNGEVFSTRTLTRILRNPVYTGNIVNGKYTSESYREGKIARKPRSEWIVIHDEERVPPLVPQELWDKCNAILDRRGKTQTAVMRNALNARRTTRYTYSGKIRCATHGRFYHRACQGKKADGTPGSEYYRCPNYKAFGVKGCQAPYLYTKDLNRMMRRMFQNIRERNREESTEEIIAAIQRAMCSEDLEQERETLLKQKERLQETKEKLVDGWLQKVLDDETYQAKAKKLKAELAAADKRLKELEEADNRAKQAVGNTERLCAEVASVMNPEIAEILEGLVRRYVQEVQVIPADVFGEYRLEVFLFESSVPVFSGIKRARGGIQINENLESEIKSLYALMEPPAQSGSLR